MMVCSRGSSDASSCRCSADGADDYIGKEILLHKKLPKTVMRLMLYAQQACDPP
jgi:hypothetical protein